MTAPSPLPAKASLDALVRDACINAGRDPSAVCVIAVSKQQPDDRIEAALAAGQRHFGENRVQEAMTRWQQRRASYPDLVLHLIGPLQTNKVRAAVSLFDVIHTLDRPALAQALVREMERQNRFLPCFIQVNTGAEAQKAGVHPCALDAFAADIRTTSLRVTGLMAIPPLDDPPEAHFTMLASAARRLGLSQLSMGMSDDWETAIACGSTHLRIGTRFFGARPPAAS